MDFIFSNTPFLIFIIGVIVAIIATGRRNRKIK